MRPVATVAIQVNVLVLALGCGPSSGGVRTPDDEPTPVVTRVTLNPATLDLLRGGSISLHATASYSDGSSRDASSEAEWSTSDPAVATVVGGIVTAVGRGAAIITASVGATPGRASVRVKDFNRVFLTSTRGTANLSTWADAGGRTGLAAADSVCQASADRRELRGTFRAWMSDSRDDAYCRIHGLSGKKSAGCGQADLPADAGPWVRMDGVPYAATLAEGIVYSPVQFDETGTATWITAITATDRNGELAGAGAPCGDWASASSDQVAGQGADSISSRFRVRCDGLDAAGNSSPRPMLCMEIGPGLPLPDLASAGKVAFVTSATGSGDLSTWADAGGRQGIAAGDAICQALAGKAHLANASGFRAWLSDATSGAADRLQSRGPWKRVDGLEILADKAPLTDPLHGPVLRAPLNVTEGGDYLEEAAVFTGTTSLGAVDATRTPETETCTNWTSAAASQTAREGFASFTSWSWTSMSILGPSPFTCDAPAHLYCFED